MLPIQRMLFLLACFIGSIAHAQAPLLLKDMQYSQGLLVTDKNIYLLGKTFQPNGQSCYTTVKKMDLQLRELWAVRIDSTPVNIFTQLALRNDTLLVAGVHAATTSGATGAFEYLHYFTAGGRMVKSVNLGAAAADACANIAQSYNQAAVAYLYNNGVAAAEQASKSVVKTGILQPGKPVVSFSFKWTSVLPAYAFLDNNQLYVLGNYNKEYTSMTQPFFQRVDCGNGQLLEKIIATKEDEYMAAAWFRGQFIDMIALSNPFNTDESQYVKIVSVNLQGNINTSKKIAFGERHWSWVGHDNVYTDGQYIYLLVKKDNEEQKTWLVKLDYTGRQLQEYALPGADNYFQFAVNGNHLVMVTATAAKEQQPNMPLPISVQNITLH